MFSASCIEKRQLQFAKNVRVTSQIFKGPGCGWTCADLKEYDYALETLCPGCMLEGISGHYLTISKIIVYSVLIVFVFRCFGTATYGTYVDTASGVVPWYHRCCVLLAEVLPLVPKRDTAGSVALCYILGLLCVFNCFIWLL